MPTAIATFALVLAMSAPVLAQTPNAKVVWDASPDPALKPDEVACSATVTNNCVWLYPVSHYKVLKASAPGTYVDTQVFATVKRGSPLEVPFVMTGKDYFVVRACSAIPAGKPGAPEVCSSYSVEASSVCLDGSRINVGTWTKSAHAGDSGLVTYSLLDSTDRIVTVTVNIDLGAVYAISCKDSPTCDLRQFSGNYFVVPNNPGMHKLSVTALSASGCSAIDDRSMTFIVQ